MLKDSELSELSHGVAGVSGLKYGNILIIPVLKCGRTHWLCKIYGDIHNFFDFIKFHHIDNMLLV